MQVPPQRGSVIEASRSRAIKALAKGGEQRAVGGGFGHEVHGCTVLPALVRKRIASRDYKLRRGLAVIIKKYAARAAVIDKDAFHSCTGSTANPTAPASRR